MMQVSKTWFMGTDHESEYPRYYAPHIAKDCYVEPRSFSLKIHFHGTTTTIDGAAWVQLKKQAKQAITEAGIEDAVSELELFTIAEHVIAGLIRKADEKARFGNDH